MGLFDALFGKRPKPEGEYTGVFKMLNGYTPRFTSYHGGIYESELIRAAINARATHISKLKVEVLGSARPTLQSKLKHGPNQYQTWSQFMYRLSSLLDIYNSAFIVPVFDDYGEVSGMFTPLPDRCEIVSYNDVPYVRYEFRDGKKAAIELSACGIMTKYQTKNDFLGENNGALLPTLELIHMQNQGIQEGVKAAAGIRFVAQVNNFTRPDDLAAERRRYSEKNLTAEANDTGLLLFPNTYTNIKPIDSKPWVVNAAQMNAIKANVFEYFGVNEDILTNAAYGDKWSAFYEGAVEAFAIQFSEVVTKMLFTFRQQTEGNKVIATANRLQYMSNSEKLSVCAQMLDRGIISLNDAREIWNLPPVEGGDERIIRGEYYNASDKITSVSNEEENDG